MLRVLALFRARRAAVLGSCVSLVLCSACGGDDSPPSTSDGGPFVFVDARADSTVASCESDSDCSDLIACTIDHCREGSCTHDPCTDCCDDGLECRTDVGCAPAAESCDTDGDCGDGIRCTLDRCRDESVCEHAPQPDLCEEGEVCLALAGCVPRPPDTCESADDCPIADRPCLADWSCDPEFGCQLVGLVDCDDDDDCTVDRCDDEAGGCVHEPLDSDGDGESSVACGGLDCDDDDATRAPGADETCDGEDDDCDDLIDEGCCVEGDPCTTECGTTGERACEATGAEGRCVPPREVCNGEDDDCDGEPDETFDCREGQTVVCTTPCGSEGVRTCTAACSYGPCEAGTEICNGLDDDCDGIRDDNFTCVAGSTVACTTSCGSMGMAMCGGDCMPAACAPPAETCNGTDDDCDGTPDDGFGCVAGSSSACATSCGSTGTRACLPDCSLDSCAPPAEVCNGVDDDCDTTCDDGFTCCAGAMTPCSALGMGSGTAICRADCTGWNTAACGQCGNGVINPPEACDGSVPPTTTCAGILGPGYTGSVTCTPSCALNIAGCNPPMLCGNGTINSGEQCDGAMLGGATCTSIPGGYSGGTLACHTNCTYNTAGCTGGPTMTCGNNIREGSEVCDGTALAGQTCASQLGAGYTGTLSCNPGCGSFNTSMCVPPATFNVTGTYATSGATTAYMCAYSDFTETYAVMMSFSSISFVQGGTTLSVSFAGLNCGNMTGTIDTTTHAFSVSCTIPGLCMETYTFSGTFSDDHNWSGTLTAGFVGGVFCYDCGSQSWGLSGSRP